MMKLEHVAIHVRDLEKMASFYEEQFGGQRNEKYHNPDTGLSTYFISFDTGARLELMHYPQIKALQIDNGLRLGIAHLAFQLSSRLEVDVKAEAFIHAGIDIIRGPRVTGDGYYEFECLDPDGNKLEITAD